MAPPGGWAIALLAVAGVILLVQVFVLRPKLDRRALQIIAGAPLPRSRGHLTYVGLEVGKVLVLAALGTVLVLERL
ncbi:hypothetical protein [Streptomyces fructofermentans]|uniref:hypothetical protein n=1 Tax=Streptomyces fructofermentans TaxID=152141 RepID=UPI0037B85396